MTSVEQFFGVLVKNVSKVKTDECVSNVQQGLFWDERILATEEFMLQGLAQHFDLMVALIDGKVARDLSRSVISEGIRKLDLQHNGKLQCEKCGSYEEWLRCEGNVVKKLLGYVRLTEYRSIDFSRQTGTMRTLCAKWRNMMEALGPKRKSRDGPGLRAAKRPACDGNVTGTEEAGTKKPIWDMSSSEVSNVITGGRIRTSTSPYELGESSSDEDSVEVVEEPLAKRLKTLPASWGDNSFANSETAANAVIYYHDYGNQKMCRTFASGRVEVGVEIVEPGDVFKWFSFADGVEKQSEFPVGLPAVKPVKAVMKKPAGRAAPKITKAKAVAQEEEPEGDVGANKKTSAEATKADSEKEDEAEEGDEAEEAEEEEGEEEGDGKDDAVEEEEEVEREGFASRPERLRESLKIQLGCLEWQAGAEAGEYDEDNNRLKQFHFSNANSQGTFKITYAKDQSYCHVVTKDKFKLYMCSVNCKYADHNIRMQKVVADLLKLPEENYADMAELKKKSIAIRQRYFDNN